MKITIKDGRVVFNGVSLNDAELDIQLKSNDILSKVDNDYTISELMEMVKVKGRQLGLNIDFVTEKIQ